MATKKQKLYIIHGWTYTTDPWKKTLEQLEKQGLPVEMLHVPGLTASSNKVWTIEEYAHWADRNIPDGAVALGHSNGGRILLNLCAEKPEKLSHLILLDSAGIYEISSKRDVSRAISKKLSFMKRIPGVTKVWHKVVGASDYDRAPANMKQTLTNMLESDKSLKLQKITTPTTILWGEADTVTPPHQAKEIHEKLPLSHLELYPGWTHAPYISHPVELARAIFRAVKNPPEPPVEVEVMDSTKRSASMSLKKASGPKVPNTAEMSAALAFKKPKTSVDVPTPEAPAFSEVVEELTPVEFEKTAPEGATLSKDDKIISAAPRMISTADVPKVSTKEKLRRKLTKTPTRANSSKPARPSKLTKAKSPKKKDSVPQKTSKKPAKTGKVKK